MDTYARPHGLNAFTLKLIAVFSMTLDHLYFYLYRVLPLPLGLRVAGRLAAPIFLYLICWSFDFTRSRPRFLLRLYLWSAGIELASAGLNAALPNPPGFPVMTDIFITMFSVLFSLYLLESAREAARGKRAGRALLCLALLAAFFLSSLLLPQGLPAWVRAALPLPAFADGGMALVLFGIGLYYVKGRPCLLGIYYCTYSVLSIWLNAPLQLYMVLALPLLLLYNRQRGPDYSCFFYLYYPLHSWFLFGLGVLLAG